ncbi:diguanylate cyclase (plasmid) [Agrobacterium sp. MA01]|uniref:diguanylate cyclase domain-containing protein n=1 Tax=Agrobacterium sp. MA01 TaxID=2664893 RepID=UPI00129B59CC|nr:diguanylate cyclase [Agrobacterium sp. MA01]
MDFSFAPDTHFTVSIGMTVFGHREQFSTVLKRADVALYRAKRLGRNRHEIDLPDQNLAAKRGAR